MEPQKWQVGQELYYAFGTKTYARALDTKYTATKIVVTSAKVHDAKYNVPEGGIKNKPILQGNYVYECTECGVKPPFTLPPVVYTTKKLCQDAIRALYDKEITRKNVDIKEINELISQI